MPQLIHVYQTTGNVKELSERINIKERDIQRIIEKDLDIYLDITFLATEYSAGRYRIDTIGIDKDNRPVIIEYKLHSADGAVIQGLSYLRWLKKNKTIFKDIVEKKTNKKISESINWEHPRVLCIAHHFHHFTIDSMGEIDNVELIRYRLHNNILILTTIYQQKITKKTTKLTRVRNTRSLKSKVKPKIKLVKKSTKTVKDEIIKDNNEYDIMGTVLTKNEISHLKAHGYVEIMRDNKWYTVDEN